MEVSSFSTNEGQCCSYLPFLLFGLVVFSKGAKCPVTHALYKLPSAKSQVAQLPQAVVAGLFTVDSCLCLQFASSGLSASVAPPFGEGRLLQSATWPTLLASAFSWREREQPLMLGLGLSLFSSNLWSNLFCYNVTLLNGMFILC